MASMLQQNDTYNVIQNGMASGVPTLHLPTIFSYLGYTNTFQNGQNGQSTSTSSSKSSNTKSSSLMMMNHEENVIETIGVDDDDQIGDNNSNDNYDNNKC